MKKIISFLAAAMLTSACAVSGAAGAIYAPVTDEEIDAKYSEYEHLYSYSGQNGSMEYNISHLPGTNWYLNVAVSSDHVRVVLDKDSTAAEKIKAAIEEYFPDSDISYIADFTGFDKACTGQFLTVPITGSINGTTAVKELKKAIAGESDVLSIDMYKGTKCPLNGYCDISSLTSYYDVTNEQINALKGYISENGLDITVEVKGDASGKNGAFVYLKPEKEMPESDICKVAADVAKEFGLFGELEFMMDEENAEPAVAIDVLGSTECDANCDGRLTIADSAAILQSMANSDKYGLSVQGTFNADFNGDGISGLDALHIQEILSKR